MARVLAVGGAHVDRTGRLDAAHVPGASNPGRWEVFAGGGTFNAARNLSRLGHSVTLVSPRGGDEAAAMVAAAAERAGVEDCPLTFLDRATPSYTAILEPDGNLVTAVADMALYDRVPARRLMTARFREKLQAADILLCDANLPADALAALAGMAEERAVTIAAIAISPAKVARLRPALTRLSFLFMNRNEAKALTGDAEEPVEKLRAAGLPGGIITAGADPARVFVDGECLSLAPPPLPSLADVTGAGDGLASGFLDAWLQGRALGDCLANGFAAAALTARVRGPVDETLTPDALAKARADMALA